MLSVVLIHHEIAVIALKIVSDDSEGACVILCQSVEPLKKVFYTGLSSKMFEVRSSCSVSATSRFAMCRLVS